MCSRGPIAIFTHKHAQEVDGVIDLLRGKGREIVRVNFCEYPSGLFATASNLPTFDNLGGLSDCAAGWIHGTELFSSGRRLKGLRRDVAMRDSNAFWTGLFQTLRCSWL